MILDSSFTITDSVHVPKAIANLNMHELNVVDDGRTALHIIHKTDWVDVSELAEFGVDREAGWILNVGFREVEIATGRTKFEWWMLDHVPLSDSSVEIIGLEGPHPRGWSPL